MKITSLYITWVHEKFTAMDGQLEIPDRPGLGITVDEDFVRRHARD